MLWGTSARQPLPPGFIEPCLPTLARKPPDGPEWIHEIKHDGYRLLARQRATGPRLYTRRGFDWTHRFPWISATLMALGVRSCAIDGEAVWCGPDGIAVFDRLRAQTVDGSVFLYAFDLLELDGEDLRPLPLEQRKARLADLLNGADGIQLSEHLDLDGAIVF